MPTCSSCWDLPIHQPANELDQPLGQQGSYFATQPWPDPACDQMFSGPFPIPNTTRDLTSWRAGSLIRDHTSLSTLVHMPDLLEAWGFKLA